MKAKILIISVFVMVYPNPTVQPYNCPTVFRHSTTNQGIYFSKSIMGL